MPFSFKIEKPTDVKTTFQNLKAKVEKGKGKLVGDDASGTISVSGVDGTYQVLDSHIEVTIVRNRIALFSNAVIERVVRNIFKQASV